MEKHLAVQAIYRTYHGQEEPKGFSKEICQLFEPKPDPECPNCKGKGEYYFLLPDDVGSPNLVKCDCTEPQADEDGLLTGEEVQEGREKLLAELGKRGYIGLTCDKIESMRDKVMLQAQRDLTAAAKDREWEKKIVSLFTEPARDGDRWTQEELDHAKNSVAVITIVKDAECQAKLEQVFAALEENIGPKIYDSMSQSRTAPIITAHWYQKLKTKYLKEGVK